MQVIAIKVSLVYNGSLGRSLDGHLYPSLLPMTQKAREFGSNVNFRFVVATAAYCE